MASAHKDHEEWHVKGREVLYLKYERARCLDNRSENAID